MPPWLALSGQREKERLDFTILTGIYNTDQYNILSSGNAVKLSEKKVNGIEFTRFILLKTKE